jgi:hypothetical protein
MNDPNTPTYPLQRSFANFVPVAFFALLLTMGLFKPAFAQTAPTLGTAQSFAVLGYSTVTNTGSSVITGDLGVSPGTAVTGFPPGIVDGGSIHAADALAQQARADATAAFGALAGQTCNITYVVPTDLGGMTLVPGVYCFASSAAITGTLTLDAGGNPDAPFIFLMGSTLITASNASVALIGGAQRCEVFWQVGSSATLGTGTSFIGTVIAQASVTFNTSATSSGRALALTGAVTLDSNTVSVTSCAVPVNAPVISKSFNNPSIIAGGDSILTLTLSNPNSADASITAPLIDTFPSGVSVFGDASTTCGGTVGAPIGSSAVSLTGGAIPANGSCTVTVDVTAPAAGAYINSLPSGALMTSNGNNVAPAVATLTVTPLTTPVQVPPTLAKSFNPATVPTKGVSTLVLTLNNSNSVVDTMTAPLTDQFPAGLTVDGDASTTCGGTVAAPMGSTAVTLTGGIIPANGSCTVSVMVTPDCECSYYNSVSAGALQTDNGKNAAPAVATLTATKAVLGGTPTVNKFFFPAEILPGASTTLTITLSNTDATAATLTAPFTDTLPSGMVVYGLPTTIPDNTCGGTLTASNGSASVTLTDGQIPANSTCAITVFVSVPNAGTYVNSLKIGTLKTSNGNNANQADATLVVSASAGAGTQLLKNFSPATIDNDGISTMTITLMNPYPVAAMLEVPLVDNMPAGMVVYGGASNTCGGAVNAPPGSSIVTLTGGSIPANGFCTMSVQVTAPCANYFNNLPAGALQTSNGGNQEPSGASLTVTRNSVLTITCSAVTTGVVGVPFDSGPMNVTGGTAPYSYSIVGSLPAGLSLNTSTGEITGTPTASGTFSMRVTDANGVTGTSCNIIIISGNTSPGYTLNVNPSSVTVVAGQAATTSFTFTPYGGFVGTVGFSCSGLPAGATCAFAPPSVTANGSNTVQTSTLTITTTASGTATIAQNRTTQGPTLAAVFFLPGLLLGSFIAWRRRSFTVRMGGILLLLLVDTILVSGALGCAGGSGAGGSGVQTGTPLSTDVVTVVANANASSTTSGASSSTQTATFTLTVTQ